MLFVKIPWAPTGVHVKLVIQEMENNVVVVTVSKKYRNMHLKLTPLFFSSLGLNVPSSHPTEVLVTIVKTIQTSLRVSSPL